MNLIKYDIIYDYDYKHPINNNNILDELRRKRFIRKNN